MRDFKPFRFWCQTVLPLVYDESLSYYELLCKVVHYINSLLKDDKVLTEKVEELQQLLVELRQYIDEYFENLNITEEINRKLDEMAEDGTLSDIITTALVAINRELICNLAFSTYTYQRKLNGSCYIGNNRMVGYFAADDGDTGILGCYDLSSGEKIWEYPCMAYHGNSVTFYNNKVYICNCFSQNATGVLLPTITVVDINNPSVILETITLPVNGVYSLTYYDNKFYAITARGSAAGTANAVTVFDTDFTVVDTFYLEDYAAINGFSTQGIQCIANGIIYALCYSARVIQAYNLEGKLLTNYTVPEYFNGYRYAGEIQSIVYNTDADKFYLCSQHVNTGESLWRIGSVTEIGITQNVIPANPLAFISGAGSGILIDSVIRVDCSRRALPILATIQGFNCLRDAVDFLKNAKQSARIYLQNIPSNFEGINITINEFTGIIDGVNGWNLKGLTAIDCNMTLRNASLAPDGTRSVTYQGISSNSTIFVYGGLINLQNVTFDTDASMTITNATMKGETTGTVIANNDVTIAGRIVDPGILKANGAPLNLINPAQVVMLGGVLHVDDDVTLVIDPSGGYGWNRFLDIENNVRLDYLQGYVHGYTNDRITLRTVDNTKRLVIDTTTLKVVETLPAEGVRLKWFRG